jgi:hypothetical protein
MSRPVLTVGPRALPASGTVPVWIDTGSGWGYERPVDVGQLALADIDDGQGDSATYVLRPTPTPKEE